GVRRWKEQFAGLSPTISEAWVAVSGPSTRSASSSARRTGWESARRTRGSVTGGRSSKGMFRNYSFERFVVKPLYEWLTGRPRASDIDRRGSPHGLQAQARGRGRRRTGP